MYTAKRLSQMSVYEREFKRYVFYKVIINKESTVIY